MINTGPGGVQHGVPQDVLQLANIPGPTVAREQLQRIGRNALHVFSQFLTETAEESLQQDHQIVLAVSQRRQLDREAIER